MGVSGDPSSARGGRGMLVVGPWRVGEGSVLSRRGVSAPAPAIRPLRLGRAGPMGPGNLAAPGPWIAGPGRCASERAGGATASNPWKGFSVFLNRMALRTTGRPFGKMEVGSLPYGLTPK